MRKILLFVFMVLGLCSCLSTKTETEEDRRLKRISDSLHADSVNRRRNTPDTAIATFKRSVECDGKQMVTFDRVKVLSGDEAAEYAIRHKRFGNNLNVVVNHEVTLETLPIGDSASIRVLLRDDYDLDGQNVYEEDGLRYVDIEPKDLENFAKESVVQIVVLHRSIVYFREVNYSAN